MAPQRCSSLNCQNLQTHYLTWQKRPCNPLKVKDINTTILDCLSGPNLITGVLKSGRGNKRVGKKDVTTDEETEKMWSVRETGSAVFEDGGRRPGTSGCRRPWKAGRGPWLTSSKDKDVSSMTARHWIPPIIQGSQGIGSPLLLLLLLLSHFSRVRLCATP